MIISTMKNSRLGEQLWYEWTGDELVESGTVFCTEGHVDLEIDVVKRALASALQRDGIATTLGEGYRFVESANSKQGYAGYVDGAIVPSVCGADGETREGDEVAEVLEVTWVCV
jgi:hypothetical protein